MRIAGLLFLLTIVWVPVSGQRRDFVWIFGDSILLDFGAGNPISSGAAANISAWEASSSACDVGGGLEIYANHHEIYNGLGQLVANGIVAQSNPSFIIGNASVTQGVLIIPISDEDSKYYVLRILFTDNLVNPGPYLYHSIVDLKQNGGNGEVIVKDVQTFGDSPITEKLTAIQHANGKDWWVIFHSLYDDTYYRMLIDHQGQMSLDSVIIGQRYSFGSGLGGGGQLTFSQSGNQLAAVSYSGAIDLFEFDRCTGEISNHRNLHAGDATMNNPFYGCAFSSNGRFLYVTEVVQEFNNEVWQLDLSTLNPWGARYLVYSTGTTQYDDPGQLKLGPNRKIYCSHSYGQTYPHGAWSSNINTYLSVIENPDSLGFACNFNPNSLYVGPSHTYVGLPNTPLYLPRMWKQEADAGPDRELCAEKNQSVVIGVPDTSQGRCIFRWSPALGLSDPDAAQPLASPQDSTMYVLTVTDITVGNSCATTTDTVWVHVTPCPDPPYQLANVFTPNGDGINDRLDLGGVPGSASLTLYDRWGSKLYHSDAYLNDWDGRLPGGAQSPDGVYWYVLRPHGEAKPMVSSLMVMR